ncbi:TonB-dependent receptor [Flavobacterium sp. HSC-61S13]|uniref:TonB-dependent receptor n=1 Tax=Flavobacterium sp. HSC-61S13 TaxID=2910963 RepID=UPI00209E87DA|nr:TonB-dependent receptor plug domain-containing protein [Flavobacterium sp. HSC-61S13]MCP1995364.1 outer membrane cobalamin receptor [Flavobacterium sp. HSC-61S13]
MHFNRIFYLFVLALFSVSSLIAQDTKELSKELSPVVIEITPYKDLIPVQQLSGKELKRLNAHTVADALRYFSGVKIKDYGGIGGLKTIDVRNMGTHHVGVFYNGVAVGNAQNGIVDLGKFSLDDIEMLQLYNGQRSTIFQSAKEFASATAVYINSKTPHFEEGKKTNLTARYKFASIQLTNPSFRLEQRVSDQISASLSAEYLHSNGEYSFRYKRLNLDKTVAYDTTATRRNGDIDAFRIEAGLYGKTTNGSWKGQLYYYDSERGLPGAIVKNNWQTGERSWDKNVMAQAELTQFVTDRYQFQIKGKFAYDYTRYMARDSIEFFENQVTKNLQVDNSYYQQDFYLSAVNLYKITPEWEVSLATDLQYNKLNATREGIGTLFTYPERMSFISALATSLNLGSFKAQASVLGTFTKEKVRNNLQAPDRSVFSPALFLSYKPWQKRDFIIHTFYKNIFRMPTFNDLYYTQIGDANLKPEFTNQVNLGAQYHIPINGPHLKSVNLKLETYYMNVKDKIIAAPTGSMFRWMMTNLGQTEGYGLETGFGTTISLGTLQLTTNINYEFTQSKNHTTINDIKLSAYGDQIPYAPWHSGSAIVGLDYKNWGLNYSFVYVGKRYDGAMNNIARNEVQPWYTHDLSLQKELTINTYRFRISAEANNILNQQYEVVTNYPMPGRNFRFILSLEL